MKRSTVFLFALVLTYAFAGILVAQGPQLLGTIEGVPAEDKDFAGESKRLAKGDVNGDGYTDLVVGGTGYGKIRVFLGDDLGIDGTADVTIDLPDGLTSASYFAHAVAVGDLNGDGYDDIVTGAPFVEVDGSANAGIVYIYLGGDPMDNTVDLEIPCPHPFKTNAYFGKGIVVGHFNTDEYADFYVAASRGSIWGKTPYYRPGSYYDGPDAETYHGIIYLYLGGAELSSEHDSYPIIGQSSSGQAGDRAMDIGDVNNDGWDDLLLGEHGASYNHDNKMEECGKVTLYLGGKFLDHSPDIVIPKQDTSATYEFFGNSLANAGDVNGDGYDDLVVGLNPWGGQTMGKVYLFYGPLRKLDADLIIYTPEEVDVDNKLNWGSYNGVAGLGDINGDGYGDFLVNGYMENTEDGKAYIFLGDPNFGVNNYFTIDGEAGSFSHFGAAGLALGDITGDGINDFAISAPNYGQTGSGKIYLYEGSADITVGIKKQAANVPSSYSLKQNYPNPFNPETVIEYNLDKPGQVVLKIYNNLGQEIKTLVNEKEATGFHKINWDGTDSNGQKVGSGIYFYKIEAEGHQFSKKMVMIK
ncbi:MAG: FG-GAP repeat protein [bacterium]|nr:MAG: FG-GAP repeat protein [bacterium]